jgi:hypothetical protein
MNGPVPVTGGSRKGEKPLRSGALFRLSVFLFCAQLAGCIDFNGNPVSPPDADATDTAGEWESADAPDDETPACPPPLIVCGGVCTNPDTDRENCGACGNECTTPAYCEQGSCLCPESIPGFKDCDGRCVNTLVDRDNCGDCGNVCAPQEVCDGTGSCSLECSAGSSICGEPPHFYCADLQTDPLNCGACSSSCPA